VPSDRAGGHPGAGPRPDAARKGCGCQRSGDGVLSVVAITSSGVRGWRTGQKAEALAWQTRAPARVCHRLFSPPGARPCC
jgi:hypothetical protein